MANKAGSTITATTVTSDSSYTYITIPEEGHYDTTSQLKVENSDLKKMIKIGSFNPNNNGGTTNNATSFDISNYDGLTVADVYIKANAGYYLESVSTTYGWAPLFNVSISGTTLTVATKSDVFGNCTVDIYIYA